MMPTYSMGRDEKSFAQADKFLPERWLRKRSNKAEESELITENACPMHQGKPSPTAAETGNNGFSVNYASIPFAVGARACVGKIIRFLRKWKESSKSVMKSTVSDVNRT